MSAAKHTPGPWVVNDLYAETEIRGPQNSGAMICVMSAWGIAADEPSPQRANARLIAAAPQLLEALQAAERALNQIRVCCHHTAWDATGPAVIAARAAIAKALGQEVPR